MAAPTVKGAVDKTAYNIGDKITLTVNYADPDAATFTLTITATDNEKNVSQPFTLPITISDPVTLTVADPSGRVWTKSSDNGAIAVYTATA